jgi:hypothetical protein
MSGEKKNNANRSNARKSTEPKKYTSTRYNARKHGLLSVGITELDDADGYREMVARLKANPLAELRRLTLERIALEETRYRRTDLLDAEYLTSLLNPPIIEGGVEKILKDVLPLQHVIDPGLPASISPLQIEGNLPLERYRSSIAKRLYRAVDLLLILEQRIQEGEVSSVAGIGLPVQELPAITLDSDTAKTGATAPPMETGGRQYFETVALKAAADFLVQ